MMAVSAAISEQAASLGVSILIGGALFLLYDIFRIFRRVVPHGNFWIGVEDFFYWLCCTAVVFVMLYRENDGMVRGFSIGGIMIGMLLYYFLLSRFVIRINVMVFGTVFKKIFLLLRLVTIDSFANENKVFDCHHKSAYCSFYDYILLGRQRSRNRI